MRISDWSSDVCSSDLPIAEHHKTWMLDNGQWQACAPDQAGRTAGFHLSSLYSPVGWRSWIEIARAWESAAMSDSRSARSEELRVGKAWVSTCSIRWVQYT